MEKVGLFVIPESIKKFGNVLRLQNGDEGSNIFFEQENFYYTCEVEKSVGITCKRLWRLVMFGEKRDKEFYSKLLSLVVPIMIQAFMLSLVSVTDALMLGFVDQTSLSSVSLAGQVQFILNLVIMGITGGTGIMAAQYWGKGDKATIEKVVPIALRYNLIFGGLFTAAGLLIPRQLMVFFTNDEALVASGTGYLRAVALSYVLCSVSQIYLTALKNTDRAKISSIISSSAVVINIIANAILIFGMFGAPRLGIVGAAIATVIARVVELVWAMFATGKLGEVQVRWKYLFKSERVLEQDYWKYTVPLLMASLVWGLAYSLYSVIMGHMGSDAVAANSITGIAKNLLSCVVKGVGSGTGIMIGNVLGMGDFPKAKIYAKRLTIIAALVGVASGGILMAISPIIVHFAPLTEVARGYLKYMLLFCGINLMFQSVNITVLDGIFCAGGDSKFDMIGNIFAMWCFSVPFGFLGAFALKWPVMIVYCIVNLDEIVKIPAVFWRYSKYIWLKNITRD